MNVTELRDELQRLIDDDEFETEIVVSIGGRTVPIQRTLFTRDGDRTTLSLILDVLDLGGTIDLDFRVPTYDDVRRVVREEIQNFASLIVSEVVRAR